jgi:catechol 2,3-dioxygenase-like lactoylglutathione lyase family enzyme
MTQSAEDIYRSANGDRWTLIRDTNSGRRLVRHEANPSSGGKVTETDVEAFLSIGGSGPEFAALRRLLDRPTDPAVPPQPTTGETSDTWSRPMAVIKVRDLAYARLRSPDLDAQEEFLTAFGMVRAARTPTALYMRGTDPSHHIHVTEKGDPKFIGFAWTVSNEEDLTTISKLPGASDIESIDEPGGGKRVRLSEPNGYTIEIVHGIEAAQPIEVVRQPLNSGVEPLNRAGEVIRFPAGPSSVKRIGHAVLGSPKNQETVRWFRETLGLVCSDDVYAGDKENIIGQFSRIDAGDDYVDHHAFFCMRNERAGLNHFSFEVQDIDDVFIGHEYLNGLSKYEHMWGIGRHLLGSQVYDYWADPWGRVHEHWADTDRLNVRNGGNLVSAEEGLRSQWGTRPPPKFQGYVSP